ncbi:MAG TPA: RES family NAD+ phosphorylase [Burkholderiaceae bacterium]|nr:RES family NAD+ phosphorylase [Burkholderiaceae bacterium]
MRAPEVGSFEQRIRDGAIWVRTDTLFRLSTSPDTEPYWSKRATYRFDDPLSHFGVLYCAQDLPTAFAESVLHNARFVNGAYEVSADALGRRILVTYRRSRFAGPPTHGQHVQEVLLADLTGEKLKPLGLNNDVSAGDDYTGCQTWAGAIHDSEPLKELDGIRYLSRQHPIGYCYAIFERSDLAREDHCALNQSEIDDLCAIFNVARAAPS